MKGLREQLVFVVELSFRMPKGFLLMESTATGNYLSGTKKKTVSTVLSEIQLYCISVIISHHDHSENGWVEVLQVNQEKSDKTANNNYFNSFVFSSAFFD